MRKRSIWGREKNNSVGGNGNIGDLLFIVGLIGFVLLLFLNFLRVIIDIPVVVFLSPLILMGLGIAVSTVFKSKEKKYACYYCGKRIEGGAHWITKSKKISRRTRGRIICRSCSKKMEKGKIKFSDKKAVIEAI